MKGGVSFFLLPVERGVGVRGAEVTVGPGSRLPGVTDSVPGQGGGKGKGIVGSILNVVW